MVITCHMHVPVLAHMCLCLYTEMSVFNNLSDKHVCMYMYMHSGGVLVQTEGILPFFAAAVQHVAHCFVCVLCPCVHHKSLVLLSSTPLYACSVESDVRTE